MSMGDLKFITFYLKANSNFEICIDANFYKVGKGIKLWSLIFRKHILDPECQLLFGVKIR